MALYLDTWAAVKLVVSEPESSAMTAWVQDHDQQVVSSDLLRTELLRVTRWAAPDQMQRARAVLDSITLLTVPPATLERAAELDPGGLRSLDAIHLAAALELGDELDGIVTYDERLARAAKLHGVALVAPI
ncbi:MAG: type II toxin-antitoxin system VapC family toxin [Candidatus Dormibacteria bacterium]